MIKEGGLKYIKRMLKKLDNGVYYYSLTKGTKILIEERRYINVK